MANLEHFPMRWRVTALLLVLLVTALLYWPSLHGPFLFDDIPNLSALTSIDHVGSWRDLGIYLSQPRYFPGRPLAMLSFLMQKSAWPDHPFPFHLVNVGIHLLNGLLVYLLALRLLKVWLGGVEASDKRVWLPATLAAAIWLINPIQIAGVVLVVQRMNLMMALFLLLGLLAYLRGLLDEEAPPRARGAWMLLGLVGCMGLSVLSKENGILLPLYALVLDATVLRAQVQRLPRELLWWRRLLIWPVVLVILGYVIWTIPARWGHPGIREFTVGERLLTEPRVLLDYLGKIFLPHFGAYGLYHDGYAASRGPFTPWTTLPAIAVVLPLVALAWIRRRRWPLFALAVLWYFGGQLLESSSLMLELYFEHRNYTPLIGIVLAIALALARMAPGQRRRLFAALASLWLVACAITTSLSTRDYASADRLALTWAHTQPGSIRAQSFLADRLYKHGRVQAALDVINRAAKLYPDDSMLAENRVYLECMQSSLTTADIQQLDTILAKSPFDRGGFDNMSTMRELAFSGRCAPLNPDSWLKLSQVLLDNPAYGHVGVAAGFLHYQRHFWAVSKGNLGMAIHELELTYKADPDANIPRLEAKYLISAGLYDQAIKVLRDTDYSRLPLLRRLLVDDRAINAADIAQIEEMKRKAEAGQAGPKPAPGIGKPSIGQ